MNANYLMIFSYCMIKWEVNLKVDEYNSMCEAKPMSSMCRGV